MKIKRKMYRKVFVLGLHRDFVNVYPFDGVSIVNE